MSVSLGPGAVRTQESYLPLMVILHKMLSATWTCSGVRAGGVVWGFRGGIKRQKLEISKDFLQSCCLSCAGVVPEVVPSLMGFNQYVPSISSQTENDKVTAPCLHSPCWLTQGQSVDKLKESSSSNGTNPKLPTLCKWLQHLLHSLSPQVAG